MLNPINYGRLVHLVLRNLDTNKSNPTHWSKEDLITQTIESTCTNWESLYGTPPKLLWEETKKQIKHMTNLVFQDYQSNERTQSFAEVPFGCNEADSPVDVP